VYDELLAKWIAEYWLRLAKELNKRLTFLLFGVSVTVDGRKAKKMVE